MSGEIQQTKGLAEIVLIVSDVRRSARFYREVVGLSPLSEPDEGWAWFRASGPKYHTNHIQRLALRHGPLLFEEYSPLPKDERWGRVHYAFEVDPEDLETAAERVRKSGVEVYGPVRLDWMDSTSYYFYDPDANLLEFLAPDEEARRSERYKARTESVRP